MKRREFLTASAGLVGFLGPLVGHSQVRPCPPGTLGVEGGETVSTNCGPADGLSDWNARINAPGVVWHHAFESIAEVDMFRWAGGNGGGNDPIAATADAHRMYRVASGGPGGFPYLEIFHTGAASAPNVNWWRPFSALTGSSNGRGTDDPAAGKTLQTFAPTAGGGQTSAWHQDYYGPQNHQQEFFVQLRCQRDPRRASNEYHVGGNGRHVGKYVQFTICRGSLTAQELVTFSGNGQGANSSGDFFRVYSAGSPPIESVAHPIAIPGQQAGGEMSTYPGNYCDVGTNPGRCWQWSGGWDTILYQVIPGTQTASPVISTFRVYAARAGQTNYTKIYDLRYAHGWSRSTEMGWNAMLLNSYQNENAFPGPFYQRWAQIIFSTEWIACPHV